MPLFSGDVSEYTAPRSAGSTRLVVDILPPTAGSGPRVASAFIDGEPVGTSTLAGPPFDGTPAEPDRTRLRTSPGDGPSGEETGRRLFSALFSGALSRAWARAAERATRAGQLELVIASDEAAIYALPWELLFDPVVLSGYVLLRDRWSVVRRRARTGPSAGEPLPMENLRILVLTAAAISGAAVDGDAKIIRAACPQARLAVVEATSTEVALGALRSEPHDIVHIVSTGERSRENSQVLLVGDPQKVGRLPGKDITAALATPPPALLMLASCETDLLAGELAQHLPAVVGMRGLISDDGCVAFLRGLYGALASGAPIGQAVSAGRAQQLSFSHSFGDEWALPVAFLSEAAQPVIAPEPRTSSGEEEPPTRPFDGYVSADLQLLRMKKANLQELRSRWEPDKAMSTVVPPFIRDQIAVLQSEVDELTSRRQTL